MPTTYINNTDMPQNVFEVHATSIPRLAEIMLDPRMNRLMIEEAIRADEYLKLILRGFAVCGLKLKRPRPPQLRRFPLGESNIKGFNFEGVLSGAYAKTFVMPRIIGMLIDPTDGSPWWVSSPEEFRCADRTLQTSNMGGATTFEFRVTGESPKRPPMRQRRHRR